MVEWVLLATAVSPIRCRPIPIGKACFLRHSNFLAVARLSSFRKKSSSSSTSIPTHPPHTLSFPYRIVVMAPLTTAARAIARSAAPRSAVRCMSATAVRPSDSTYESPFRGSQNTTKVPDFSHYAAKNGANKNLMYQYFMVGALGTITAAGAKSTIQGEPSRAGSGADGVGWWQQEESIGAEESTEHTTLSWIAVSMGYVS